MENRLGISLLTYNHDDLTRMTLESLYKSVHSECILDIQDDGSSKSSVDALLALVDELKSPYIWCRVMKGDNQGLIKARNQSYRRLLDDNCKYIAVIHNDMMFADGMFEVIMKIMDANPDYGIVAAETLKVRPTQEDLNSAQYRADSDPITACRGNNHPAVMRASALNLVLEKGLIYDESFGRCDNEDIDLLGRLEDAGFKTLVTTAAWAYHQGEASRSKDPNTQQHKNYSRAMYEAKWRRKEKPAWEHRVPNLY